MQNFRPIVCAEYLGKFIHDTYVRPARERGDRVVTIRVREVCEALSHGYSETLVRGVLGSMKFRNAYRLPLVAADEHADGIPATFMFKLQRHKSGLFFGCGSAALCPPCSSERGKRRR